MEIFLGIDGGGTKTEAVIIDLNGALLGRGSGGPGNLAQNSDAELARSLHAAIGAAIASATMPLSAARFTAVCAGMAGYSVEERRLAFAVVLRDAAPAAAHRIEPDYVIAYWGASHGKPGIAAIAGTGAVSYGSNAQGETARADGLGYLLGDRGSGFDLGLRVLRHTLDQMTQDSHSQLTEAVSAHTGARNSNEIVQWLYRDFRPARVAALAPAIGKLAEEGDPDARDHIAAMARRLRNTVRKVRHQLWLPHDTPVYRLGGLWNLGEFFRSEFVEPQWRSEAMPVKENEIVGGRFLIGIPLDDPAIGAALLARAAYTGQRE